MYWTEKRAFIACSIFFGISIVSAFVALMLMAMDPKDINVPAVVLSFVSAAVYVFILFNARLQGKKHDKEKSA